MDASTDQTNSPPTMAVNRMQTPALVWDIDTLDERLAAMTDFADQFDCTLYYSVKAAAVAPIIEHIEKRVAGFSCSSPFEAQLASHVIRTDGEIQVTSPALSPDKCGHINGACTKLSFNSLSQMSNLRPYLDDNIELGLRINPQVSVVADPRVDPCRENSKLGVALSDLLREVSEHPDLLDGINGFHIHTGCGTRSFRGLEESVDRIATEMPETLAELDWFNLGGGYMFDKILKVEPFARAVQRLRGDFGLEVIIEPGTAIVQAAASLLTTVVDLHESQGRMIAVLDTMVGHMPEVFTYGFSPPVRDASTVMRPGDTLPDNTYVLAGASCLPGDQFGIYRFEEPLDIGQQLTIEKMGAYTHSQWQWFNGINLPTIYTVSKADGLRLAENFSFPDYARHCAD